MRIKFMFVVILSLFAVIAGARPRLADWSFRAPSITDKDAIDPTTMGDIVFETNTSQFYGWNGSSWTGFTGGASGNLEVNTYTSSTVLTTANDVALGDASGASITITLATASGNSGKVFTIKKIDASTTNTITVDGIGSETIDGNTTVTLSAQNEAVRMISDGSNWRMLDRYPSTDAELYLDTGNGHGSTNTKIRRFTNSRKNTLGQFATYADSATAGMSVTINIAGTYSINYADLWSGGAGANVGISVNSSTLTTSIASVSYANGKRAIFTLPSASYLGQIGLTLRLAAGDIVRVHTDGLANGSSDNNIFHMVRIGY